MEYLKDWKYDPARESMILVGADQTGKTTHAISTAKMLSQSGFNIIILDHKRRYTSLDPFKVIHHLTDITGKGLQILQPLTFTSPEKMHQYFNDLSWIVYSYKNIIFVIDELHSWFRDKRTHIPSFELFCRECHNQNSSFIGIFQSPSEVPTYIMRNSYHRFILYLDLESDVQAMKNVVDKKILEKFRLNEIKKYEGFYKQRGQKTLLFKVTKSD